MKKIIDFFKSKTYVTIWTACYAAVMWAILQGLFEFPVFSAAAWDKLFHAHLRGFAGFTFGILILSALPLYVATTMVIARTGKPLFSFKMPERIRKLYAPPPAQKAAETPTTEKPKPATYEMPSHLPTELHGAFMRARSHALHAPTTAFSTPQISTTTDVTESVPATLATAPTGPAPAPAGELPLPTDFDFDDTLFDSAPDSPPGNFAINTVPTFSEITFGDNSEPTAVPATSPAPAPEIATDATTDTDDPVLQFFTSHNRQATIKDELVFCDDMVIATHNDPDFWIADEENWFANGKSRPSPISKLHATATDGLRPILYLAEKNILDIETQIAEWQSSGITVVDNLDTLL